MVQISYIYAYNVEAGQSTGVSALASFLPKNTHWKRLWCWEGLGAGGEGDDRGWDGWMASPTRLTWVWVNSGSWWWTGRPGRLQSMGSQRVGHDWATELNWTPVPYLHSWLWEPELPGFCFRWTLKELSRTYTCIHFPPNSPPIQAGTKHWAQSHSYWLYTLGLPGGSAGKEDSVHFLKALILNSAQSSTQNPHRTNCPKSPMKIQRIPIL